MIYLMFETCVINLFNKRYNDLFDKRHNDLFDARDIYVVCVYIC